MSHAREERRPASLAAITVGGILVLLLVYLLPFFTVLIDEAVLKTYVFSNNFPAWVGDVFETVYWPLLVWFD